MQNVLGSEAAAIVAVVDPDAYAAGTVTSAWVDMGLFDQILAAVAAGDLTAASTLDAKLEQAQDSTGTGAKDIAGKAITQLTQAGGDSNKQALINCRSEELDVNGGFSFARLSVTATGGTGGDAAGMVLGLGPRYGPASKNDLASVAEIVN
jgi:hypothetical protein